MRTPLLWSWPRAAGPAQLAREPLTAPVSLARQGRALVLLPVDESGGGTSGRLTAVLLVPDAFAGRVRLDRAPVGAGMHPLRHGAHLDFEGQELWVSTLCSGTEEPFGPEVHGPDRHCFRVKAKLKAGEPVVVCPGVPSAACGVIYKAAAWRTVQACANCGHAPGEPAWAPPAQAAGAERRSLRELLARAAARRA